jgi:hypothetical protein
MFTGRFVAVLALSAALLGLTSRSVRADRSLLVIPARYAVVQFSADVLRLRPADMIVYDTRGEKGDLILHAWNSRQHDWAKIGLDELRLGAIFDETPTRVFIVGSDRDIPPAVAAAVAQLGAKQIRVNSLRVVDMVNTVNGVLNFTSGEWRWLARRHGLQIVDLNADRRHYGRYGAPGGRPRASQSEVPAEATPAVPLPAAAEAPAPAPAAKPTPAPAAENPDQPAAAPAATTEELRQPGPVEKLPEDK